MLNHHITSIASSVFVLGAVLSGVIAPAYAASIDDTNKHIWSENVGWLNAGTTEGAVQVLSDHLEGYAWSDNIGWIRLGTHTTGGAHTYTNTGSTDYGVNRDNRTGVLSGYAWSENIGWINFGTSDGSAHIADDGVFSGYVWSDNIGWIKLAGTATDGAVYGAKSSPILNAPPTLTAFSAVMTTTNEDTEVAITMADLTAKGDETDIDGTVDGFVVSEVSSGTLKIGADAATAEAWSTESNNLIDAANHAYWTPAEDAYGTLAMFKVKAVDNDGEKSAIGVQTEVDVTSVNDAPIISTVSLSGDLVYNQVLTTSVSGFSDPDTGDTAGDYAYQWQRATDASCSAGKVDISGANSSTYTLAGSDVGHYICVAVTPKDNHDLVGATKTEVSSTPVVKAQQVISFELEATRVFSEGESFEVSATGEAGGEPLVISSNNEAVCTVSGSTIKMLGLGACTLVATQAGNEKYMAAEPVSQTIYLINPVVENDADSNDNGIGDVLEQTFGSEDADSDGIPDTLEDLVGADVGPATDSDGDGTPDVVEILNGRDPTINDNSAAGAPTVTASATQALLAKGVLSTYTETELSVSAEDEGAAITPVAYAALGACKEAVPYNYQTVCTKIPDAGYASGTQSLWWLVTDNDNNWGKAQQTLNILPQVSFNGDLALAGEPGSGQVVTRLTLSGPSIDESESDLQKRSVGFTVPFTVSGTGSRPEDHDLANGVFTLKAGETVSEPITITLGSAPTDGDTVVITLDTSREAGFASTGDDIDITTQFVTAGDKTSQTVTINQDSAYPPRLSAIKGSQGSASDLVQGLMFDRTKGDINISFTQVDPDNGDYTYSWTGSDSALNLSAEAGNTAVIRLSELDLAADEYYVEVQVSDSTAPNSPAAVLGAMVALLDGTALSATLDSDGDGKTDAEEGLGDSDGDGRSDYLDGQDQLANVAPTDFDQQQSYLVTTDSGVRILFGTTAVAAQAGDTKIGIGDLAQHGNHGQPVNDAQPLDTNLAHLFDYELENLSVPEDPTDAGHTAQVTLPLDIALTAESTFLKYDVSNGWSSFVENTNNKIAWSHWQDSVAGNCPAVGDAAYSRDNTQKAGTNCVQITIQDGGPNDADGVVNGRIIDPLGISFVEAAAHTETGTAAITTENNGGGSMGLFELLLGFTALLGLGHLRRRSGKIITAKKGGE